MMSESLAFKARLCLSGVPGNERLRNAAPSRQAFKTNLG